MPQGEALALPKGLEEAFGASLSFQRESISWLFLCLFILDKEVAGKSKRFQEAEHLKDLAHLQSKITATVSFP